MAKYHTLVVREITDTTAKWGVHFGDYDLDCVKEERNILIEDQGVHHGNTKIVTTRSDDQKLIDEAVAKLND